MKDYFKFSGTASRSEYWGVHVVGFIAAVIGYMISFGIMTAGPAGMFVGVALAIAVMVAYGWLWISTTIRRCRSAKINPWWTAAVVIPYIGLIVVIVIGVLKPQENG